MTKTNIKIEGVQWSKYFVSTDTCLNKIFRKIIIKEHNRLIKRIIVETNK